MSSYWIELAVNLSLEIAPALDRTKTDTGRRVENTKALERMMLKELGKLLP